MREQWVRHPLEQFTNLAVSDQGDRVALTAHGHVALAGVGTLRRVDVFQPPASRLRNAVFMPDGKNVLAVSDASGENELWLLSGRRPRPRAPAHQRRRRLPLAGGPSPDGRWVAHDDKNGRLWLLDVASGKDEILERAPDRTTSSTTTSPGRRTARRWPWRRCPTWWEQRHQIGAVPHRRPQPPRADLDSYSAPRRCSGPTVTGCGSSPAATSCPSAARPGATATWARSSTGARASTPSRCSPASALPVPARRRTRAREGGSRGRCGKRRERHERQQRGRRHGCRVRVRRWRAWPRPTCPPSCGTAWPSACTRCRCRPAITSTWTSTPGACGCWRPRPARNTRPR